MYYTYMIRCIDDSIYTGITTDIKRRMLEHFMQNEKSAKYTKRHKIKKLEAIWESENKSLASKLEYRIKSISKQNKEKLILNNEIFNDIFNEILDVSKYKYNKNLIEDVNLYLVMKKE